MEENYEYRPTLAVVIPMFNAEKTIARTLQSVLNQSVKPSSVVVVDDGSTDSSAKLVSEILGDLPAQLSNSDSTGWAIDRVRILYQENRGEGAARNAGIAAVTSEWVALIDSDDIWYPDHLAEITRIIGLHPHCSLVGTSFVRRSLSEMGDRLPTRANQRVKVSVFDYFVEASRDIGVLHSSTVALRRTAVQELGGFGTSKTGADLEMWARVALQFPVARSSKVTSIYLQHDQSVMAKQGRSSPPGRKIEKLEDLSPTFATVVGALKSGSHCVEPKSLTRFINSRLLFSAKASLVQGEIDLVKRFVGLSFKPRGPKILIVATIPDSVLRIAYQLWRVLRPIFR